MATKQQINRFETGLKTLNLTLDNTPYFALLDLLSKWNRAKNLTAITDYNEMIAKHLLDSLTITPFIKGETILDVGTGAGFPGLPLAIYYPNKQFYLCDSNGKKTAFIIDAIRVLGLKNVTLVNQRVEQYAPNFQFDCIMSRAFSALDDMIDKTKHLKADNGYWLAMKGQLHQNEFDVVSKAYDAVSHRLAVPFVDGERHAIEIK